MTLALGVDVGTSGIRTAVIDETGAPLSMARRAHAPQDRDRIDATLWWERVLDCLASHLTTLRNQGLDPEAIVGIAVDGTSGTMVLTDANLQPVTRALMYNSRGFDQEAAIIARSAPEHHITRGSASALARALRLWHEDCEGRASHLLHQADYILAKLTGVGGQSDVNNALKTGVDPVTCQWPDWLAETGIAMPLFPRVHDAGARIAPIRPALAKRLGLPRSVMVHAGTTDSVAAFLACTDPEPGIAVTSLGTTLAVKAVSTRRVEHPDLGLYSHRLGTVWLTGGASNTGGGVLESFFTIDEIMQLCSEIDPSSPTGLDYYPLVTPGERFPVNDPTFQPRLTPRPRNDVVFLQGMMEGMATIETRCYAVIRERGGDRPQTIFTAGGGARNPVWTAIRARVLDLPLHTAPHTEAAIGTARLVFAGRSGKQRDGSGIATRALKSPT